MPGPRTVLLAVTVLFAVQLAVYYPHLPDTVASHFDAAGRPDGHSSKQSLLAVTLILGAGILLLFLGLDWLVRRLPASMVNLPHREYWLGPERREATLGDISRRLLWFGAATQFLLAAAFHLLLRANLGESAVLPVGLFWPLLIGYFAFTIAWLAAFVWRYRRPARAGGQAS